MKQISDKAKSTWDKFRKERDFHKMHHKRVVQEKNKLVVDLKRLKNHYANYEPMLKMMRGKYETAMKARPPKPRLPSTHPTGSPMRPNPNPTPALDPNPPFTLAPPTPASLPRPQEKTPYPHP